MNNQQVRYIICVHPLILDAKASMNPVYWETLHRILQLVMCIAARVKADGVPRHVVKTRNRKSKQEIEIGNAFWQLLISCLQLICISLLFVLRLFSRPRIRATLAAISTHPNDGHPYSPICYARKHYAGFKSLLTSTEGRWSQTLSEPW